MYTQEGRDVGSRMGGRETIEGFLQQVGEQVERFWVYFGGS